MIRDGLVLLNTADDMVCKFDSVAISSSSNSACCKKSDGL